MAKPGKDTPVLKGYIDGPHFIVWCPLCVKWHYHGAEGGEGHRVAHCDDGGFDGYYVQCFTTAELAQLGASEYAPPPARILQALKYGNQAPGA